MGSQAARKKAGASATHLLHSGEHRLELGLDGMQTGRQFAALEQGRCRSIDSRSSVGIRALPLALQQTSTSPQSTPTKSATPAPCSLPAPGFPGVQTGPPC